MTAAEVVEKSRGTKSFRMKQLLGLHGPIVKALPFYDSVVAKLILVPLFNGLVYFNVRRISCGLLEIL